VLSSTAQLGFQLRQGYVGQAAKIALALLLLMIFFKNHSRRVKPSLIHFSQKMNENNWASETLAKPSRAAEYNKPEVDWV